MAAIYMWFDNEQMVLTTTLYPIEVIDNLRLSADVTAADMRAISADSHSNSGEVLGVTVPVILITYGPNEEFHQHSSDVIGIDVPVILISYGPNEEFHQHSSDVIGISKPDLLVIVDTPDEMLRLKTDVYPAACSMTAI